MAAALTSAGCAHARLSPEETRTYVISESPRGLGGSGYDCDAEHNACFDRCWHTVPPAPYDMFDEGHYKYCTTRCLNEYMDCVKAQEAEEREKKARAPLKFSTVDKALEWLRAHKSELVVGTLVVIAGTTFVVTTGGTGALLLAPLAL